MSVTDRMIHRIAIERATAGTVDDYGQPTQTWGTASTVPAFIVTKSAKEVALLSQGGAVVSAITIGVPIGTDLDPADRLHHDPAVCPVVGNDLPDRLYQTSAVRDASGAGIYLRADASEVS